MITMSFETDEQGDRFAMFKDGEQHVYDVWLYLIQSRAILNYHIAHLRSFVWFTDEMCNEFVRCCESLLNKI